jgi:hypothetical protein
MHGKRLAGIVLAISSLTLLLVSASTAATSAKRGGTIVLDMTTDVDYIDPQLSYYGETWKLEATTACKLMNWPDKEGAAGAVATPEVSQGLPLVSKDGKTYTFTIRKGFRFSNGKPVNAQSFVDAINRFANPKMQSTGVQFLDIIKGAQAAVDGKAGSVSGVKARGNKLVVQLTKASPDLLARVAMPFYQAIDPTLAKQIDANGINQYASCGPYYFASRTPGRSITLKRNPYYKGGRAANADTIQVNIGNDVAVEFQNVEKGTSDYASGGIPATEWKNVVSKYGLNKKDGRVQVRPQLDVRYVALNHSRPLFKDNPQLAKAVNWAVDRQAFSARAATCTASERVRSCRPGCSATSRRGIYPLKVTANTIKQARKLAGGQPPRRQGRALVVERRHRAAPGTADPVQPEADRDRRGDQAPPARAAVHERGEPADGDVRHDGRAVGRRLRRPVRLREHPARREPGHPAAAQQLRVLQRREIQQGDDRGVAPSGAEARSRVRGARREHDATNPPWAPLVNSNDRIFLVVARGVRDDQRDLGDGPASERALPEVTGKREGEGRTGGRPPRPPTRTPTDAQLHHQATSLAVVLFVGVTLITYVLFFLLPADPARLAAGKSATAEDVRARLAPARPRPAGARAVRLFLKRLVVEHSLGRSYANRAR